MMKVYQISAVTLMVKNMEKSCNFYSRIPGSRLEYGGSPADTFTTFKIGDSSYMHINLELRNKNKNDSPGSDDLKTRIDFGRIIFHTEDVDKLYFYLKDDDNISKLVSFENEPINAPWGERFFHIRDPDGYQLSFAMPIRKVQP
jgi:catechol 2,3-dioxygenase-like lactoylglutathione lyase family enzyme